MRAGVHPLHLGGGCPPSAALYTQNLPHHARSYILFFFPLPPLFVVHYLLALGSIQLILSAHMVLTQKDLCARMKAKVHRYRDLGIYSIGVVLITAAAAGRTGDATTVVCTLERDFGCIEDLGGA